MEAPYVRTVANGTTDTFDIPFPYLRRSHVKAYVNDAPYVLVWVNGTRIRLLPKPPAGARVDILRETPAEPIWTFQDNRPQPAVAYQEATLQVLYHAEEARIAAGLPSAPGVDGKMLMWSDGRVVDGPSALDINALSETAAAATAAAGIATTAAAQVNVNNFQPKSDTLTTLAGGTVTSAGLALLDDADAPAQRTTLGLGSVTKNPQTLTDWDLALTSGWWMANGAANAPASGWMIGEVRAHNDLWVVQRLTAFTAGGRGAGDTTTYERNKADGTWGAWYRIRSAEDEIKSLFPFTKEYTSAQQTITSGGLITLTHGLGAVPKLITGRLVCITAEAGYAVGDVVAVELVNNSSSGTDQANSVVLGTSNIAIRLSNEGGVFAVGHKGTGARTVLTNANWKLVVSAYA